MIAFLDEVQTPRNLAELSPGEQCRVVGIAEGGSTRHRLLEMGLTRGAAVQMIRVAPLGDPIELQVRGYRLSVRKAEAATVMVEMTTHRHSISS